MHLDLITLKNYNTNLNFGWEGHMASANPAPELYLKF